MKIMIMAALAASLFANAADAASRTSAAQHHRARDYNALSLHTPIADDGVLHGPTHDTSSTATGGPAGGFF